MSRKHSILFKAEGLRSTTPTSYDFLTQELLEARATGKRPAAATHTQGDLHPEAASFHPPREDVGSLQQLQQGYQDLGANIWMAHQHNDSMALQGSGSIPRSSLPPMANRDDHYFVARLRDPGTGLSSQTHGEDELFGVQTLAANEASPHDRKERAEATLAPAPASHLYVARWEAPSHAQDVAVPSANASAEFEPRTIEDMQEDAII